MRGENKPWVRKNAKKPNREKKPTFPESKKLKQRRSLELLERATEFSDKHESQTENQSYHPPG